MLGTTGLVGSSGDGGDGGGGGDVVAGHGGDGAGIELFEGERSGGGNRWPRQETLALLKIRSDMDGVFRDSSLKGPLWEQVSRKMGELGFHRNAKKCKEKFENVYKYHKRTKDGRVGKSEGKSYRFFEQLEALEQHQHPSSTVAASVTALPPQIQPPQEAVPVTMVMPSGGSVTVPSSAHPISAVHVAQQHHHMNMNPTTAAASAAINQIAQAQPVAMPVVESSPIEMEHSPSATPSSSSSTSSDEELLGRRKRKRKWKDFFEKLMREVIDKQEEFQKRFLEAVEKREHDRVAREEGWKAQEISRLNREHEILVQERSMAAAKDAALVSFLQKLSEQQQISLQLPVQIQTQQPQPQPQPVHQTQVQLQVQDNNLTTSVAPQPLPQPQPLTQLPPPAAQQALVVATTSNTDNTNVDLHKANNGDDQNLQLASSSRWPKAEVEALINLRTTLDQKYQDNGPKGPLWEEISASMGKLGYNRNAKRCKEKWENINKYFKKVKESNKKRPEDSKTCPYFHQLDAIYREKTNSNIIPTSYTPATTSYMSNMGTTSAVLAQPDQQWPVQATGQAEPGTDSEDDEDDDDQGSGYEIVANNNAGATTGTTTATGNN